jgi:hypothetical protein
MKPCMTPLLSKSWVCNTISMTVQLLSSRQRDIDGAAGVGGVPDFNQCISTDRNVKPDKSITQTHVLAETSCTVSNWV